MSSPGIRYANLARVLRNALPDAKVTLAAPRAYAQPGADAFDVVYYDPAFVVPFVRGYDVVIGMSCPLSLAFAAPLLERPLFVLDFFSQFYIEWMEASRDLFTGLHRRVWIRASRAYTNLQLALPGYILCANERQRDSYIGALTSLGLLAPATYVRDPMLWRFIDVAPHGVRPVPLPPKGRAVKGRFPGIEEGDKLLLWLGGILYWYDPLTLLRAVARVRKTHPEAKLLFLGAIYPGGEEVGRGLRLEQAIDEAKRLGLLENGVYFHKEWLPYEEVVDYLLDADIGVTTYFTNAETRYAHRTRFQDYIWARLPIVCTEGDVLADEITARGWGVAVPERDEDALVAALLRLLEDEQFAASCRANLSMAVEEMTWEAAFAPLVRFLSQPGGPVSIAAHRSTRRLLIWRSALSYLGLRLLEQALGHASGRYGRMAARRDQK